MIKTYAFVLLLLFAYTKGVAQSPSSNEHRPKIGLVLSGGGAKGMAHIGVLKVLEELNIRPDYIAGTSMGSIMGGLYAVGYSAAQLDSILRQMDWSSMLSDRIPLSKVVPEEKHKYNRFLFQFDLTKNGPLLPEAMVVGQGIMEEMNWLTWHVVGKDNFDDFEIPFRCVASDLVTGQPYVFSSGSLVTAMRASMAIPTIFSPVRFNSMLLVDGGVLNNIPVQACRDMGADIVITVNVGFRHKPSIDDFQSISDILMGSAMIRSNYESQKALDDTDILIAPDLSKYSSASFYDGAAIIDQGEIAARERYDELASLSEFLSLYPQKKKVETKFLKEVYIEDIHVGELKHLDKSFVLGKSGLEAGKLYTKAQINEALHRLVGTRYFQNVSYLLSQGERGYVLTLLPTESYRSKYNFAVHYDNSYKVAAIFNVAFRNTIIKGSNLSLSLNLSEYPIFKGEFIDYRGNNQLVGNYLKTTWEFNSIPLFGNDGSSLGGFNQNNLISEAGILYTPNTKQIVQGGVFYKRQIGNSGRGLLDLLTDDVSRIGNHWWGLNFNYNKNSFDKPFFINSGSELDIDLAYPLGFGTIYTGSDSALVLLNDLVNIPREKYLKAKLTWEHYLPAHSKISLSYFLSAGGATENLGNAQYFNIGGLKSTARTLDIPFPGMIPKEVSAQQFVMAQLHLRYQVFNKLFIHLSGGAMDYETKFEHLSFAPGRGIAANQVVFGGNLLLTHNSIVGPIEFGYGRSNLHHKGRWFFTAGFPF
ncbi:NTE family protein [Saccharicrinis carchari]|uniref:NTE family protein n=1 Tax=Saccharicrinis carchari TaxID=1168039 RepID=A0A521EH04_SACCC|nr:patatin-like phospholipase family protein [Saccharicrinis carchari]SMO82761.1 NTE family protein [Saccharicrinis carchari]